MEIPSRNPASIHANKELSDLIAQRPALLLETYRVQQLSNDDPHRCESPEHYIFWDEVHPTETMHKVIAAVLTTQIETLF